MTDPRDTAAVIAKDIGPRARGMKAKVDDLVRLHDRKYSAYLSAGLPADGEDADDWTDYLIELGVAEHRLVRFLGFWREARDNCESGFPGEGCGCYWCDVNFFEGEKAQDRRVLLVNDAAERAEGLRRGLAIHAKIVGERR